MNFYESNDDWGFFVEIDNDTENCRKYSYLKCYNEWRKYNVEIIEEGEYENYDLELELYSNNDKNVYYYNYNYNNNNSKSCFKDIPEQPINCINRINSCLPYFCIISALIYFQFL